MDAVATASGLWRVGRASGLAACNRDGCGHGTSKRDACCHTLPVEGGGELARCGELARRHGVPLDPVWTLAAWDEAEAMARRAPAGQRVMMLHTGGVGGALCGLAQRYPDEI